MLQVGNYLVRQTWRNAYKCTRLYATTPRLSARALELCRPDGRVGGSRFMSSLKAEEEEQHPFSLIAEDMQKIYDYEMAMVQKYIKNTEMYDITTSYHHGLGDMVGLTAALTILFGKILNYHLFKDGTLLDTQVTGAAIVDLLQSVTAIRDDLADGSNIRRGKPTTHCIWNHNKVIAAGNMALGICFGEAATLGNDFTLSICQMHEITQKGQNMVIRDVWEDELLGHYMITQDYKTASLFRQVAISQARAVRCKESLVDIMGQLAYYLGRCYGCVDDVCDFESDVKEGTISSPAIFAMKEHPELREIVLRKFSGAGDVEKTMELVTNSQGFEETRDQARMYRKFAMDYFNLLADSPYKEAFLNITRLIMQRMEPGAEINEVLDV